MKNACILTRRRILRTGVFLSPPMTEFEILFGIKPFQIRPACVVAPFVNRYMLEGFGIHGLKGGAMYKTGDNGEFTLIYAGAGGIFVGDCVQYLKNTPCEDIFLFGACARLRGEVPLGTMVNVRKAFSCGAFADILSGRNPDSFYMPDETLFGRVSMQTDIIESVCASVSSLKMEKAYTESAGPVKEADVADLETASFFASAEAVEKRAVSILFITDIPGSVPYYNFLRKENRHIFYKMCGCCSRLARGIIGRSIIL